MKIKDLKVGQKVAIVGGVKREETIRPATVTKVGRKYATAIVDDSYVEKRFKEVDYQRDSLVEDTRYGGGAMLFPSMQAAKDYESKQALRLWLHQIADWGSSSKFTLEQLRKVKAILCPDDVPQGD